MEGLRRPAPQLQVPLVARPCNQLCGHQKDTSFWLIRKRPNRPSQLVRPAIRSALLDSLSTRANKCLNLGAQRQHFVARWFAEVPVVARLSFLKGAG